MESQKWEECIENWLQEVVGHEVFKDGLVRLKKILQPYLNEFNRLKIKVVTIAGTNGKGETTLSLSHLLQKEGKDHVVWISPHISSIRERILHNGKMISYESLWDILKSEYVRIARLGEAVSYYELLLSTFTAFTLSIKPTPEFCLLEVGIGGRLDGVNLFNPFLTAITSISRDHEDLLGKGYKKILWEKWGITRPHTPLITSLELSYCSHYLEKWCGKNEVPWWDLFQLGFIKKSDSFGRRNQLLAYSLKEMATSLRLPQQADFLGRQLTYPLFKGRREEMSFGKRHFIFIGSHNLDGVRKLVDWINGEEEKGNHLFDTLLFSLSKRSYAREPEWMTKALCSLMKKGKRKILATTFSHFKALTDNELKSIIQINSQIGWVENWKSFVQENWASETVLVTGSYYFVGEVQNYLQTLHDHPSCRNSI